MTTRKVNQEAPCIHYWIILPAKGPVSEGTCQNCSETREFKNSTDFDGWSNPDDRRRGFQGASEIAAAKRQKSLPVGDGDVENANMTPSYWEDE